MKKAFTLIELLVVIIIVAILASIAVPIIGNMKAKAICTEAITMLGAIITAEKLYYTEHDRYYASSPFNQDRLHNYFKLRSGGSVTRSDLDGTYFSEECYIGQTPAGMSWSIRALLYSPGQKPFTAAACVGSWSNPSYSPKADEMKRIWPWDWYIAMDTNGNIYSDIEELGYPDAWDL